MVEGHKSSVVYFAKHFEVDKHDWSSIYCDNTNQNEFVLNKTEKSPNHLFRKSSFLEKEGLKFCKNQQFVDACVRKQEFLKAKQAFAKEREKRIYQARIRRERKEKLFKSSKEITPTENNHNQPTKRSLKNKNEEIVTKKIKREKKEIVAEKNQKKMEEIVTEKNHQRKVENKKENLINSTPFPPRVLIRQRRAVKPRNFYNPVAEEERSQLGKRNENNKKNKLLLNKKNLTTKKEVFSKSNKTKTNDSLKNNTNKKKTNTSLKNNSPKKKKSNTTTKETNPNSAKKNKGTTKSPESENKQDSKSYVTIQPQQTLSRRIVKPRNFFDPVAEAQKPQWGKAKV